MIGSETLDTLMVDRRGPSRNPATSAAVRASRRKLVAEGVPEEHVADDLVLRMSDGTMTHAVIMATLVLVTGLIGTVVLDDPITILWAGITTGLYLFLAIGLKSVGTRPRKHISPDRFAQAAQLPIAAVWVWFVLLGAEAGAGYVAAVYRADTLLAAMAVAALTQVNIRNALTIGFGPAVIAMLFQVQGPDDAAGLAMFGVAAGGLAFFTVIASRAREANLASMRLQYEKDALIGELETAKAISDSARHKAEEANLAKSRFLASMSHELRTPLNAILGFSEVMAEEILGPVENPTYAEYVRDIQSSGQHLLALINEILDLSRIEADRYPLDLKPNSLAAIAANAANTLRVKADQKGITIEQRFADGLFDLRLDERAIRQSILNLLSNAIKFTPRNGKVAVTVGRTAAGGQYVSVIDNGPGIPKEELGLVMSAFGQGSIAIKHAEQGTGLGLAIVQALVGKHGGRFILASQLREGTTATLLLPASACVAEPDAAPVGTADDVDCLAA